MRNTMKAAVLSLLIGATPLATFAGAGQDHGHSHEPVTQKQAETLATASVSQLVSSGKVDPSWKTVNVAKSEQKNFGGNMEWVISFKNEKISDPAKQTLYVLLSLDGQFLAANYTGK